MSFARILVGIDFSRASRAAFAKARALVADGGRIDLLHVLDGWSVPPFDAAPVTKERARLEAFARTEREGARAAVSHDVRRGVVAQTIVSLARERGADAIVLGSRSRGRFSRFVHGSVAEEVARTSKVPTLVVREDAPGEVRRVLVAVDFSDPSVEAIRAASRLARSLDVPLEAIHVVERGAEPAGELRTFGIEDPVRYALDGKPQAVASLVRLTTGEEVSVHVPFGRAADEIAALTRPSDVLVCGTHGRGGLERLAIGSVAAKVLRLAPCPVVVVPAVLKPAAQPA